MHPQHKSVFFDVAERRQCWIGLREPNPLAAKWIGRSGYAPKPLTCKAKTSDNPAFTYSGLVADPKLCEDAFAAGSRADALAKWEQFAPAGQLPTGYKVVDHGQELGLVQYMGNFLHADYDLMAINRSNRQGEFLPTSQSEQQFLFSSVASEINRGIGLPLIQHGAEMMWTGGVGGRASEFVFWFGPGRRFQSWPSSMPFNPADRSSISH